MQLFPPIDLDSLLQQFIFNPAQPMLFSSGLFVFLFTAFSFGYALLYRTHFPKVIYVLIFSLFFYYKSSGNYYLVLIFCIIFDYALAIWIYNTKNKTARKWILAFSLLVNIGVLFYFKYTNFFIGSYNSLSGESIRRMDIFLPVGVSFFTFQSMSYTIDVFRNKLKPVRNIFDYAFYVSFFPQIVAGPIVRAVDFIPQLYKPNRLTKDMLGKGMFLIAIGLFKKAVISDYISLNFVDRIFDNPALYSGVENLMGVYGYTLQIYCDFSGYSDMAIGIALLLGFRFPLNFDSPYQSKNITEFWRRWHISLSTWLRDYLYISLGGNRKGNFLGYLFPALFFVGMFVWGAVEWSHNKVYWPLLIATLFFVLFVLTIVLVKDRKKTLYTGVNQMTTMLLGGFWHGPDFRFILWGAMHGIALAVHKAYLKIFNINPKEHKSSWFSKLIGIIITFHFVAFCWIFFRANSMESALQLINQIAFKFNHEVFIQLIEGYKLVFILMFIGYFLHFIPKSIETKVHHIMSRSPYIVLVIFLLVVVMLVAQIKSSEVQPFIYFQF